MYNNFVYFSVLKYNKFIQPNKKNSLTKNCIDPLETHTLLFLSLSFQTNRVCGDRETRQMRKLFKNEKKK